jgi:hypothetical protein
MALRCNAELIREEDFQIRRLKGQLTGRALARLIDAPAYQRLPDDAEREILDTDEPTLGPARTEAKGKSHGGYSAI